MLGPETSQTRKATAGTRAQGLRPWPCRKRAPYRHSEATWNEGFGKETKPPKTKANASRTIGAEALPEPRGIWPQRSRPDTAWATLFFELPETSSQAAAAAHPGSQTVSRPAVPQLSRNPALKGQQLQAPNIYAARSARHAGASRATKTDVWSWGPAELHVERRLERRQDDVQVQGL